MSQYVFLLLGAVLLLIIIVFVMHLKTKSPVESFFTKEITQQNPEDLLESFSTTMEHQCDSNCSSPCPFNNNYYTHEHFCTDSCPKPCPKQTRVTEEEEKHEKKCDPRKICPSNLCPDLSKFVLKSSVKPCPMVDFDLYMKKNECKVPDMSRYVLKSTVPSFQCSATEKQHKHGKNHDNDEDEKTKTTKKEEDTGKLHKWKPSSLSYRIVKHLIDEEDTDEFNREFNSYFERKAAQMKQAELPVDQQQQQRSSNVKSNQKQSVGSLETDKSNSSTNYPTSKKTCQSGKSGNEINEIPSYATDYNIKTDNDSNGIRLVLTQSQLFDGGFKLRKKNETHTIRPFTETLKF